MKGKYRDAESKEEVESILKEEVSDECIIWQNSFGERIIYDISCIVFGNLIKEFSLKVDNYSGNFDPKDVVYIKLSHRETMLKTTISKIEGDSLFLALPDEVEVKTKEMRIEKRTPVHGVSEKVVTIKIDQGKTLKQDHSLRLEVVDISDSGICLFVSKQNKNFLENAHSIILTHLGESKMGSELIIKRRYTHHFRYKKLGRYTYASRVGFEVEGKFNKVELSDFLTSLT